MFVKHDKGKLRYDLIPPKIWEALAEVFTYGAVKYGENNWRECDNPQRFIAALYRHLIAWQKGEIYDAESGIHHLAHAMVNVAFLLELEGKPLRKQEVQDESSRH